MSDCLAVSACQPETAKNSADHWCKPMAKLTTAGNENRTRVIAQRQPSVFFDFFAFILKKLLQISISWLIFVSSNNNKKIKS
jgi:hypothetical protein